MDRPFSGKWIVLQGIAIVGSILLAFAIEAWWSDEQEAEELDRILSALRLETSSNIEEIARVSTYRSEVSQVCNTILASSPQSISRDELDNLLADLSWWYTANFNVGALSSMSDGGKLALVHDPELVLQVSKVNDLMRTARLAERQEEKATDVHLIPYLFQNGSMPQISNLAARRGIPGNISWEPTPPVPDAGGFDHRAILEDNAFRGIILIKKWAQHDSLHAYNQLRDAMAELIELLPKQ